MMSLLRHGWRGVEVDVRLPLDKIHSLDMLKVLNFRGVRCLIDTFSYSLPGGRGVMGEMKAQAIVASR